MKHHAKVRVQPLEFALSKKPKLNTQSADSGNIAAHDDSNSEPSGNYDYDAAIDNAFDFYLASNNRAAAVATLPKSSPGISSAVVVTAAAASLSSHFASLSTTSASLPARTSCSSPTSPSTPSVTSSVTPTAGLSPLLDHRLSDSSVGFGSASHHPTFVSTVGKSPIVKPYQVVSDIARTSPTGIELKDLRAVEVVGSGSYGVVQKMEHIPTGKVYAMKELDVGYDSGNISWISLTILHQLMSFPHRNVVRYFGSFPSEDENWKVVQEYIDMGTLSAVLKRKGAVPMLVLGELTRQVLDGLAHIHQNGILHRDLKPANLFLSSEGLIKLGDFGSSTLLRPGETSLNRIGSTAYMSPERVRGEPYEFSSDVWSVGVLCAECALGVYPMRNVGFPKASECIQNPFTCPFNVFNIELRLVEDTAAVDWSEMLALIAKFHPLPVTSPNTTKTMTESTISSSSSSFTSAPNSPPTSSIHPICISPECEDFVAQCMQQSANDRPSAAALKGHSFVLPMSSDPAGFSLSQHSSCDGEGKLAFREWIQSIRAG